MSTYELYMAIADALFPVKLALLVILLVWFMEKITEDDDDTPAAG